MKPEEHRIFDDSDEEPPDLSFFLTLIILTVLPLVIVLVSFLFLK